MQKPSHCLRTIVLMVYNIFFVSLSPCILNTFSLNAITGEKLLLGVIIYVWSSDRPIVSLQMGGNLDPKTIKEADDVYFECHINSNPEVSKVIWSHNVCIIDVIRLSGPCVYLFFSYRV